MSEEITRIPKGYFYDHCGNLLKLPQEVISISVVKGDEYIDLIMGYTMVEMVARDSSGKEYVETWGRASIKATKANRDILIKNIFDAYEYFNRDN